jgi:6-phosphogluconolactonase
LQLVSEFATYGGAPCHLAVDPRHRQLYVANYNGGSVTVFPLRRDGGLLEATQVLQHQGASGVDPQRQSTAHAHSIDLSLDREFAVSADLGTDKLHVYRFGPQGELIAHGETALAPGSGPRHLAFQNTNRRAFVINELAATVTTLDFDFRQGVFQPIQSISTLPQGYAGRKSTAEIAVHPSGRFVYGSNRGHDSIAVFQNRPEGLQLIEIEPSGGQEPRNFALCGNGKFLLAANQKSNSIQVFAIDPRTGALTPTEHRIEVPTPVCLRLQPTKIISEQPAAQRIGAYHQSLRVLPSGRRNQREVSRSPIQVGKKGRR